MKTEMILVVFVAVFGAALNTGALAKPMVNIFFADCFQSKTGMDYTSVIDFIIFHSSWFENSDVGTCTSNPDLNEEAECWKNAFRRLLVRGCPLRQVANECVDLFVEVSRNLGDPSYDAAGSLIDVNFHSLDNSRCPSVDMETFVAAVEKKIADMPVPLLPFDETLADISSIVSFVQESVKCNKITCDSCNHSYLRKGYPPTELDCGDCWPTRLAGMIKSSSPLKQIFTNVATKLGNNQPVTPPLPFLNDFIAYCLNGHPKLDSSKSWDVLVDFIIYHTSWFENSNKGSCRPGNPDLREETQCWLDAYTHLVSSSSSLLEASQECIIQFANWALQIPGSENENVGMFTSNNFTNRPLFRRCLKIGIFKCRNINQTRFTEIFEATIRANNVTNLLSPIDKTLSDVPFIVEQVISSLLCTRPVCDSCGNASRRNGLNRRRPLRNCCWCWPKKLERMIKDSSPLKTAAEQAVAALFSEQY